MYLSNIKKKGTFLVIAQGYRVFFQLLQGRFSYVLHVVEGL